jgi:hypothetical protein
MASSLSVCHLAIFSLLLYFQKFGTSCLVASGLHLDRDLGLSTAARSFPPGKQIISWGHGRPGFRPVFSGPLMYSAALADQLRGDRCTLGSSSNNNFARLGFCPIR